MRPVDPIEFETYDEDGGRYPNPPVELPLDEAMCANPECGESIGFVLSETEDMHGNVVSGLFWQATWQADDGQYYCEDCYDRFMQAVQAVLAEAIRQVGKKP